MTITDAIILSGGFNNVANRNWLYLIRNNLQIMKDLLEEYVVFF